MNKLTIKLLLSLTLIATTLPAFAEDPLVIYSGRSDKFVKPVIKVFTESTGIQVIIHAGKSTGLLNKLRQEGSQSRADLYLSNDAGSLQKGTEFGLFAVLPDNISAQIPNNYRAADNTWVGLSARARVLVVNTKSHAADSISSVFDLADPKWKGRLGITNSSNESFIAGTTIYMLTAGKEKTGSWLKGMKNNAESKVFNKHSKIVKAVASGKKDVGLVNHYYIYRHLDKHPDAPIKLIMPDQGKDGMGVAWNVAGIAIVKYSKKRKSAEKLVEFLLSKTGQKQFAEVNHEYPTRIGVAASPEVPAIDSFRVAEIPMSRLGTQRNATIDLIESIGMP